MKAIQALIRNVSPLRSFRSPDDYSIDERQDADGYLLTLHSPQHKIVKALRSAQPLSDPEVMLQMSKPYSQSRAAHGAAPEPRRKLLAGWTRVAMAPPCGTNEPAVTIKLEPQEPQELPAWDANFLFRPDGQPLTRAELQIGDDTPLNIDTAGMKADKAARYRQELRQQIHGWLDAWEQGTLPQWYADVGIAVMPASFGLGVRAQKSIPAGTLVGLYGGKVFNAREWEAQYPDGQERELHCNYLLQAPDKERYIDARDQTERNYSAFLNHPSKKAPRNLRTLSWGPLLVGFVTTRRIEEGQELTFPYGWHPHFSGTPRNPHVLA